jgi:uncharacterized iron-regulated membrane protein
VISVIGYAFQNPAKGGSADAVIVAALAAFLLLFGITVAVVLLLDRLVIRGTPRLQAWFFAAVQ